MAKGKIENLKHFEKGQSGNPNGRPPKLISSIIKQLQAEGYEPATPTLIRQASEYLITLDRAKIEAMAEDDEQPMYLQILARELLGDKGEEVMNRMIDRAHGKAKQSVEHSGGIDTNFTVSPADTDAIKAIFEKVNGNKDNQSK